MATRFKDLHPAEQNAFDVFIAGTNIAGGMDGYRRLLDVVLRQMVADHGGAAVQYVQGLFPKDQNKFLIWSGSHEAWWKAYGMGYTTDRDEAGIYTSEDLARYQLDGTSNLRRGKPTTCDVLVPVED